MSQQAALSQEASSVLQMNRRPVSVLLIRKGWAVQDATTTHCLVNKEGAGPLYPFRRRDWLEFVRVGHGSLL